MYLEKINSPADIKSYSLDDMKALAQEMRDALLKKLSIHGGFGEKIARFYGSSALKVLNFGLKKEFLDRYNPADILAQNRLTKEQIVDDILSL